MASPPGPGALPYRGEDRRRVAGPLPSPFGRPFVLAAVLVVLAWVAATWALDVTAVWAPQAGQLIVLLQTASVVIAVGLGLIVLGRWYLTSDTPALWIGVGLLLYGAVRLGVAELSPLVVSGDDMALWGAWIRPAAQVMFIVLLGKAVMIPPVMSSTRGWHLAAVTVGGLVTASLLFWLLPPLAAFVDGAGTTGLRAYGSVNQIGVIPFAFGGLAAAFLWKGYTRRRWLFAWIGLALVTLALGDLVRVTAPPPMETGLLGKEAVRLLGLVLGLNGAVRELLHTYRDHSTRLAHSEYTAISAEERIREGRALAEERAHEARSALAAIEGATRTLEHYRDRLPSETQASLSTAISGEIRRLQRLVSVEQEASAMGAFSIAEALSPLVATERARGVEVDLRVPGDLVAVGRLGATEEVLQTLFDNARRYAPATRVTVRAHVEGEWVVIRVEDRGPGVAPEEREAIFRRGVRGDHALDVAGSGLGLYVAAKLMREQGGELWVDNRPGGGASFALALPAASVDAAGEDAIQSLTEVAKVGDERGMSSARRGD